MITLATSATADHECARPALLFDSRQAEAMEPAHTTTTLHKNAFPEDGAERET
ncbi:MAG: hypothetical protein OEQ47_06800 [Acidimicrobiia bacterium]|nr:hypothetical protein [Acidimicrobiia bacterium]